MVISLQKPIKLAIVIILSIILGIIITSLFIKNPLRDEIGNTKGLTSNDRLPEDTEIQEMKQLSDNQFVAVIKHKAFTGLGLALLDENYYFNKWLPDAQPIFWEEYPGDHLNWWSLEDINKDGYQELAIQFVLTGSGGTHPFYLYQYKDNSFQLLLKFTGGKSDTNLIDLNSDSNKEILYSFVLDPTSWFGRNYTPWKEVWIWQDGKYQLANNLFPDVYNKLLADYEELMNNTKKDNLAEPYQPVIKCLQEKANLNIQGQLADGKECSKIIFDD